MAAPGGARARAGGGLLAAPGTVGAARRAPENFTPGWPRAVLSSPHPPRSSPGRDREPLWDGGEWGNGRPAPPTAEVPRPTAQRSPPPAEPRGRGARELTGAVGAGGGVGGGVWDPGPRGRSRAPPAVGGRWTLAQPPSGRATAGDVRAPAQTPRAGAALPGAESREFSLCAGRSRSHPLPQSQSLPLPRA